MTTSSISPPARLATRSQFHFTVRPAAADDAEALLHFFEGVSVEDLRFRFFSALEHVRPEQVAALVKVDHSKTENFLAFAEDGTLVATAMLACDGSFETAEVAIAIREDHKGRGIGWTLLGYVAEQARARGVKRLQSIESRDNHSAIELEREMGFTAHEDPDDPSLMVLERRF